MGSTQSAKSLEFLKFYFIAFLKKKELKNAWLEGLKDCSLVSLEKIDSTRQSIINSWNVMMYTNHWETYEKLNCCISHQEDANCGEQSMTSIQKQGIWECKLVQ